MIHRRTNSGFLAGPMTAAALLVAGCVGPEFTVADTGAGGQGPTSAASGGAGGVGGVARRTDPFVDPAGGDDAGPGTEEEPFKTLGKALSVAEPGQTVTLFGGTYGEANGDDFLTPVPDGVNVSAGAGGGGGGAVLRGSGTETGLTFAGSGSARYLRIEQFATGIRALAGTQELVGLELTKNDLAVHAGGTAEAALRDSLLSDGEHGLRVSEAARMTVTGAQIKALGTTCNTYLAYAKDASQLVLEGVAAQDTKAMIRLLDGATGTVKDSLLVDVAMGCRRTILLGGVSSLQMESTTLVQSAGGGSYSAAVEGSEGSRISITGGHLGAASHGIQGGGEVTIDGTTVFGVAGSGCGICPALSGTLSLQAALIKGFQIGVQPRGGAKIRNTRIQDNGVGVRLDASPVTLDLGTAADPGGNVIQGNAGSGLQILAKTPGTSPAVGNTWIPLNQGSDADGMFAVGTTVSGQFGTNTPAPRNVEIPDVGPSVKLAADVALP